MGCLFINLQCEKQPCYSFWLMNTRLLVIVFAEARLLLKAWKTWIRAEGIGCLNNYSFHPQAVALQEGFASHSTLRDSLCRLQTLLEDPHLLGSFSYSLFISLFNFHFWDWCFLRWSLDLNLNFTARFCSSDNSWHCRCPLPRLAQQPESFSIQKPSIPIPITLSWRGFRK